MQYAKSNPEVNRLQLVSVPTSHSLVDPQLELG